MGSIPSAYLAGKYFSKIDIRRHGSGNVGATNAFRVLGKKIGTLVFATDFTKGFLPVLLARGVTPSFLEPETFLVIAGTFAILGHIFTPFLGFKGGKGVATGAGVLCAVSPTLFFACLGIWLVVFLITRIVAISSLASLVSLLVFSSFLGAGPILRSFFLGCAILVFWTHRTNLTRLFQRKESKF